MLSPRGERMGRLEVAKALNWLVRIELNRLPGDQLPVLTLQHQSVAILERYGLGAAKGDDPGGYVIRSHGASS
jgi:hypothetical protein